MSRNQTARATVPLQEPISLVSSSDNDEDLVFVKTHNPSEQPTAAAAGPTRAELAKDEPLFGVDWDERGDATTALKTHSTAQGARIQQTKKSGGQCFTFMCDSVLAKGMPKEENAGDVRCKFLAQVNKVGPKGSKCFRLSLKSNLKHQDCNSSARPSAKELIQYQTTNSAVAANKAVPARQLLSQWTSTDGVNASRSTTYRVRDVVADRSDATFLEDFELIAPYLDKLVELNEGTHTAFEVGLDGAFIRLFYAIGDVAKIAVREGFKMVQLDGAHMKTKGYNSTMYALEGFDGDGKNLILAIGLLPKENEDGYIWFLEHCLASGLGELLEVCNYGCITTYTVQLHNTVTMVA